MSARTFIIGHKLHISIVVLLGFGDCVTTFVRDDCFSINNTNSVCSINNTSPNNNSYRYERFLFDALFKISSGLTESFDSESDEENGNHTPNSLKNCDCDCGVSNEDVRIVGGQPTGVNQFPWIARIVYNKKFHCGGSLITKDHILTASHCVKELQRSKIRIIFGDHNQHITSETNAVQRAVSAIIKHRDFDALTYNNDIALLRLKKPIQFSKIIRPICLPPMNYNAAGHIGTVVGWGRTSEGGELPSIVNQVKVPILTTTECQHQKYKSRRITSSMLCAGKAHMDSCQGDSGGPLLLSSGVKYYIVGIVSWGVGCGREGYPGVYTQVSKFIPWIRRNLIDTCLCL